MVINIYLAKIFNIKFTFHVSLFLYFCVTISYIYYFPEERFLSFFHRVQYIYACFWTIWICNVISNNLVWSYCVIFYYVYYKYILSVDDNNDLFIFLFFLYNSLGSLNITNVTRLVKIWIIIVHKYKILYIQCFYISSKL